jgi:hypothetical protein
MVGLDEVIEGLSDEPRDLHVCKVGVFKSFPQVFQGSCVELAAIEESRIIRDLHLVHVMTQKVSHKCPVIPAIENFHSSLVMLFDMDGEVDSVLGSTFLARARAYEHFFAPLIATSENPLETAGWNEIPFGFFLDMVLVVVFVQVLLIGKDFLA